MDFARLRIRRCPPFILDGHAVLLTNAVAVAVPVGWVIASDPTLPAATNLTAVFELGDTPDARVSLDVATLSRSANRSLAVNFSSRGEDGVANRYGFRLESFKGAAGPEVASQPVQALSGERVEAVRAEVLALPPLEAGPPQYRLKVPELGPNEVTIRWSGIAGVLERASGLEPVLKLRGVLRRGILAAAKAARPEHPQAGCKDRANAGRRQ